MKGKRLVVAVLLALVLALVVGVAMVAAQAYPAPEYDSLPGPVPMGSWCVAGWTCGWAYTGGVAR